MITASAGTLWIAAAFDPDETSYQNAPWTIAYLCMAGLIGIGMATVLLSTEPQAVELAPRKEGMIGWVRSAVLGPFHDFVSRYRWTAVLLLALIATYRISDIVLGVMSNPFYRDMGFTKDEVAAISGVYGVVMTLIGAAVGGVLSLRYGVMRILLLGAALSSLTNLLFAWLATRGHDVPALVFAISADNLSAGIASAAFIAYLSGLTNVAYSATQYALFSSIMLLLPKFVGGWSGLAVDSYGYPAFFIGTAVLGIPVLALAWLAARAAKQATMAGGGG
jgi:PAT family beta-lactamase induction signal transducer AmpG